jgi:hypothetical protein
MEMLPAACQRSVSSIVGGNGSLISRSHSRVTSLDEVEAKSGATTTLAWIFRPGKQTTWSNSSHPSEGPQPEASRSISR